MQEWYSPKRNHRHGWETSVLAIPLSPTQLSMANVQSVMARLHGTVLDVRDGVV